MQHIKSRPQNNHTRKLIDASISEAEINITSNHMKYHTKKKIWHNLYNLLSPCYWQHITANRIKIGPKFTTEFEKLGFWQKVPKILKLGRSDLIFCRPLGNFMNKTHTKYQVNQIKTHQKKSKKPKLTDTSRVHFPSY